MRNTCIKHYWAMNENKQLTPACFETMQICPVFGRPNMKICGRIPDAPESRRAEWKIRLNKVLGKIGLIFRYRRLERINK